MGKITNIATGEIIATAEPPVWVSGIWECGNLRFTDPGQDLYQPVEEAPVPPTVGAIAFQRLFTRAERAKARELRATDLELDDIWRQIEDPRTDVVVMALPSVQDDIEYTLQAVKAGGLDLDVAERKATILTGQVI